MSVNICERYRNEYNVLQKVNYYYFHKCKVILYIRGSAYHMRKMDMNNVSIYKRNEINETVGKVV